MELLIVMMIIGVLSIMAVGGYSDYRRAAMLDLSVDNLVSQIYTLRDYANYGDYGSEENVLPKCFGMKFGGENVEAFEVDYSRKKSWDAGKGAFVESGCGENENPLPIDLDEKFYVIGVYGVDNLNAEIAISDLSLSFVPPRGDLLWGGELNDALKVLIVVEFGNSDFDKYKRKIYIDIKSGKISITRYSE